MTSTTWRPMPFDGQKRTYGQLRRPRMDPDTKKVVAESVKRLHAEGMTLKDAAYVCGVSVSMATRLAKGRA